MVHGLILASVSDNSPQGYNLTFAFWMILFIVIAGALYVIYSRPHKVPGHGPLRISSVAQPGALRPQAVPEPEAARDAATAAGPSTAAGGGTTESVSEAAGAHVASASTTSGSVSEDENQAAGAGPATEPPAAPGDTAAGTPPNKDEASE
ncbi:MAG: hypothetical protein ACRDPO_28705 [Streptosporangiaceae bacterium]